LAGVPRYRLVQEISLKHLIAVVAALSLLTACGAQHSKRDVSSSVDDDVTPAKETFALGSELTHDGAVAQDAANDRFKRGGEVFLSICTKGSSTDQTIEVAWIDPAGAVIQSQTRIAPRGAHYIAFSSGRTAGWRAGEHHAVIVIDGRRVSEKTFALL
jgi:hypothetical protein